MNSFVGLTRAAWQDSPLDSELERIQHDLFEVGAQLAAPGNDRFSGVDPGRIEDLERAIDEMDRQLPPLTNFILPGGSPAAAHLHVSRTICRRAERLVVALGTAEMDNAIAYLNRVSDYLFVAARFANLRLGAADVMWKKR